MDDVRHRTGQAKWKAHALVGGLLVGVLAPTSAFAQFAIGFDDGGVATRDYGHSGIQLLRSFSFEFADSDHHLRGVSVSPDSPGVNQLSVTFEDANGDDDYSFRIEHIDADPSGIFLGTLAPRLCQGICTFPITRPAGDYVFVLRGFQFRSWLGNDNHVQHIGIYEQNANLTVAFHDSAVTDAFDAYTVDVQYAYVPRSRFAALGTAEAWDVWGGQQFLGMSPGLPVIRGFDFGFTSSDHHIRRFSVIQVGGGLVEGDFNDINADDHFNWAVDWAIVN